MLSLSEIKVGKVVKINGDPYVIIKTDHHKQARGGAVLKTKLRNLLGGNVIEQTYQGNDKVEEAEVENKSANFMYKDDSFAYFMDNESYEQFNLPTDQLGEQIRFLKEGENVSTLYFQGTPMTIKLPIKVELKVTSAPPSIRGNSAGNVMKTIELETGAMISAPMFIETGEMIRVNTELGEYVERV